VGKAQGTIIRSVVFARWRHCSWRRFEISGRFYFGDVTVSELAAYHVDDRAAVVGCRRTISLRTARSRPMLRPIRCLAGFPTSRTSWRYLLL